MASTADFRCDVCGVPGDMKPLTLNMDRDGTTTIYCDLCAGLVDAGLIRAELVDGVLRYRQWHIQPMTPGELLPARAETSRG